MKTITELPINEIVQGNVLSVLRTFPSESVDMVVTSPPYWGLRHYGTSQQVWGGDPACRHVWRDQGLSLLSLSSAHTDMVGSFCEQCEAWRGELGLEPYFILFIQHLCDIFDEIKRVLKSTGTCWVNLGDTYASKGTMQSRWAGNGNLSLDYMGRGRTNEVSPKSLCQIPSRFAIEMTNRGWLLRNEIIWHKPNCIPASVKDRFTVDFDKVFFFTKAPHYYFEMQYEPYLRAINRWGGNKLKPKGKSSWDAGTGQHTSRERDFRPNPTGRNKRTVWSIPTQGFKEAHFATYPERLVEIPLKSGCPEFVCRSCGKPREKILRISYENHLNSDGTPVSGGDGKGRKQQFGTLGFSFEHRASRIIRDEGYTDCGCNAGFEPGIVLDPFMGSGTTALVASKLSRSFVGIELNPEYIDMAERRLEKWRKDSE